MKPLLLVVICLILFSCNQSDVQNTSLKDKEKARQALRDKLKRDSLVAKMEDAPPPQLTDIDGNVYKTVRIGYQVWMAENLRVTRFRNGDSMLHPVGEFNGNQHMTNTTQKPAWYYVNYDKSTNKLYGKLYSWYAVSDSRNIAPKGWHVPTPQDYLRLEARANFGDGRQDGTNDGTRIMQASKLWQDFPAKHYIRTIGGQYDTIAMDYNSIGFNALPAGAWDDCGQLGELQSYKKRIESGQVAAFWTSSIDTNSHNYNAYHFAVTWKGEIEQGVDNRTLPTAPLCTGMSVRLIKDE